MSYISAICSVKHSVIFIDVARLPSYLDVIINRCYIPNKNESRLSQTHHIIFKILILIFLIKAPNYREPQTINFSKALIETTTALDTCIETITVKTKYTPSKFKTWKEKILAKVKKITELN